MGSELKNLPILIFGVIRHEVLTARPTHRGGFFYNKQTIKGKTMRDIISMHIKIIDRYFQILKEINPIYLPHRMTLLLSLEFSKLNINQLQKLLDTSDENLTHDVSGINNHIDRDTKIMDDSFLLKSLSNNPS